MQKIFFALNVVDSYPPVSKESVWSDSLASGLFKIKNIPFYTKDVSLDDEVSTDVGADGELVFKRVVCPSDNSTLRVVFFDEGANRIKKIGDALVSMGCTWEGMGNRFLAVNVPGVVDFDVVISLLDDHVRDGCIDYEFGMIRQ